MNKELLLNFISKQGYKKNSPDKNRPMNVIPSNNITMKDVEFPIHGIDNQGNEKIMQPGMDYRFPGDYVIETPLIEAQQGGQSNFYDKNSKVMSLLEEHNILTREGNSYKYNIDPEEFNKKYGKYLQGDSGIDYDTERTSDAHYIYLNKPSVKKPIPVVNKPIPTEVVAPTPVIVQKPELEPEIIPEVVEVNTNPNNIPENEVFYKKNIGGGYSQYRIQDNKEVKVRGNVSDSIANTGKIYNGSSKTSSEGSFKRGGDARRKSDYILNDSSLFNDKPTNEDMKLDKKYKQGGSVHAVATAAHNLKNLLSLSFE